MQLQCNPYFQPTDNTKGKAPALVNYFENADSKVSKKGPLASEYQQRISLQKRQRTHIEQPVARKVMEWFEEPAMARMFQEIIQAEQDLEILKQSLALRTDFSMIDVWSLFDIHGIGKISRLEFEEVYAIFQMNPTADEMALLYRRYSQNGEFEFADLVRVFTPRDERYR